MRETIERNLDHFEKEIQQIETLVRKSVLDVPDPTIKQELS